jgi:hypothetical protein
LRGHAAGGEPLGAGVVCHLSAILSVMLYSIAQYGRQKLDAMYTTVILPRWLSIGSRGAG